MTAEQIYKIRNLAEVSSDNYWRAEIAAQLAELNETMKNKSSIPSTEP